MVRTLLLLGALLPCFCYCQLTAKNLTTSDGRFIGFFQYTPSDYQANLTVKYPLIIFMHGIGERGNGTTELWKVRREGIPKYIFNGHKMKFTWNGKTETFLVLAPQCPDTTKWYFDDQNYHIREMIKYAKANLRIDENRIVIAGLSMGGGAAWKFASSALENAQSVAAIATTAGACVEIKGSAIPQAKLPVWSFHAIDDTTPLARPQCTFDAIDSINKYNPIVKPILSVYPNGYHIVWDRSFDTVYKYHNPNIYEWFLAQNRSLPPNMLPVSRAGNDISITISAGTATLSATSSYDTDGSIVKYFWRKISGPAGGSLANATSATATASSLTTAGTYSYELKVVDNRVGWTFDTVNIIVTGAGASDNQPPVARAGADQTITLPVNSVALSGNSSTDADGWVAAFFWAKISGPATFALSTPNTGKTNATGLVEGVYTFRVTATDNKGATASDDVLVTVKAAPVSGGNQPPVARAGADQTITLPTNSVTLSANNSTDSDGWIASFSWTKVNGPASFMMLTPLTGKTTVNSLVQGVYTFRVTAMDNKGGAAADDVVVTVNGGTGPGTNQPPVARAGPDQVVKLPVNSVVLNANASTDADGWIASFVWTKFSGPATYTLATPNTGRTYVNSLGAGVYTFRVTATDGKGASATDDVVVTVNQASASVVITPHLSPRTTQGENLVVYPSFASHTVSVVYSSPLMHASVINIYNGSGMLVKTISVAAGLHFRKAIDLAGFHNGMYYLQVAGGGKTHQARFIKIN